MDQATDLAKTCLSLQVIKAECLALLKKYEQAENVANDVLRIDSKNIEALYTLALCRYYTGSIVTAISLLVQAAKFAPDHAKVVQLYKVCSTRLRYLLYLFL